MKYILKRILYSIPSIILVLFITFFLSRVVPGDPARMIAGEQAPEESVQKIREEMGLNQSIPKQFVVYIQQVSKGDFGRSLHTGKPVTQDFGNRFPASVELALVSMAVAVLIGIPIGIISAVRKNSFIDNLSRVIALLGTSIPVFWLGYMLIYMLYSKWGILPAPSGRIASLINPPTQITGLYLLDSLLSGDMVAFKSALGHIVMPAFCLSLNTLAVISRMTRSSMLETLNLDFMRTAKAKGISQRKVIIKHGFSNVLVPVLTVIGTQFGALIGNAVIIETVFSWPGVGSYVTRAILSVDYAPVQAFAIISVIIYILINLALDILYAVVDPRIRYGKSIS